MVVGEYHGYDLFVRFYVLSSSTLSVSHIYFLMQYHCLVCFHMIGRQLLPLHLKMRHLLPSLILLVMQKYNVNGNLPYDATKKNLNQLISIQKRFFAYDITKIQTQNKL